MNGITHTIASPPPPTPAVDAAVEAITEVAIRKGRLALKVLSGRDAVTAAAQILRTAYAEITLARLKAELWADRSAERVDLVSAGLAPSPPCMEHSGATRGARPSHPVLDGPGLPHPPEPLTPRRLEGHPADVGIPASLGGPCKQQPPRGSLGRVSVAPTLRRMRVEAREMNR